MPAVNSTGCEVCSFSQSSTQWSMTGFPSIQRRNPLSPIIEKTWEPVFSGTIFPVHRMLASSACPVAELSRDSRVGKSMSGSNPVAFNCPKSKAPGADWV